MIIGMDISVLYVARAGVLYYHYHLLKAMIKVAPETDTFVLLDYPAIHGYTFEPPDLSVLDDPRVTIRQVKGLRHRKLSRMDTMQKPGLYPFAQQFDRLLDRPWGGAASSIMARQLTRNLSDVDIWHTSDVVNLSIPGIKSVTTIHDLTTMLFPEYHKDETVALLERKFRFAKEEADVIIAVSESTKQDLVHLLDIEPERIQVIYEGVEPRFRKLSNEEVNPILTHLKLQPGNYLLYVGTIEPRKNLLRLLDAYDRARVHLSRPWPKLVLAGAVGWQSESFFTRIDELNLADDVLLLGPVDIPTLTALYNGALVFVLPSLYEGFGLPALEAMACGTPVITSNVSSLPEVVGDAAVLINPSNTDELAEAIVQVINDSDMNAKLRAASLERAQLFTWERAAMETLSLYRQAIND